ncbi:cell division protein FtsZ [Cronobacter turicensis]|nr:cell division protein FtsZ [Cronobacter turicensis]
MFRSHVRPGMLIRHDGCTWRASANVEKGLYLDRLTTKTRISAEIVEVLVDSAPQVPGH